MISTAVLDLIGQIEQELQEYLDEVLIDLTAPLDYATDRECSLGNVMADALRLRKNADVAVLTPGPMFTGSIPAGPLRRQALYSVCPAPACPGLCTMTGEQLLTLVQRGQDPEMAADKHQALRGQARGFTHLSGAIMNHGQLLVGGQPVQADKVYRVAGSDFEFEPVWGYVDEEWQLAPTYEMAVILREALADYLSQLARLEIENGRFTY